MISKVAIKRFAEIPTPFYYYDIGLLKDTLSLYTSLIAKYKYNAHYAIKANAEPKILQIIQKSGLGADCVSGNEIKVALKNGFDSNKIVYAGVGKSDREIKIALKSKIFCFNCESIPEIKIINDIASSFGVVANISLRVNPNIDAHTHKYISTGREEDKFGISPWEFSDVVNLIEPLDNIKLIGLHFHIGSQITDMNVFSLLCKSVEQLQCWFIERGIEIKNLNLGGGLGIDYQNPQENPIPNFKEYFAIIKKNLIVRPGQKIHFEPGRALVGQCGHLISKVLYVKNGKNKNFVILDAGMNNLIRPALYQAHHDIENLVSKGKTEKYDIVGPVCESSDVFCKEASLAHTNRGDLIAIHSAGAYGQVMGMRYNLRDLAKAYYSDDF